MQNTKRIVIASVLGLVCGGTGWAFANFAMGYTLGLSYNLHIILSNVLLGFVIGISLLRWHWALHGLVLGGIFGLKNGLVALGTEGVFIPPLVFGFVYGFLIELITTVVFKAGVAPEAA